MSERDKGDGKTEDSPGNDPQRADNARSFFALAVCVLGLIIAVGSAIATLFVGVGVDVISGGVVGIALGIVGYFLGAGRLAIATVIVSLIALFAGLLVNQLIPGVGGDDRELPAVEPRAEE